jgi:hypothetical protein
MRYKNICTGQDIHVVKAMLEFLYSLILNFCDFNATEFFSWRQRDKEEPLLLLEYSLVYNPSSASHNGEFI